MRMDKLTSRFQQALSDAQSLAVGRDHNLIEPAHLLLALLDQKGGGTRPMQEKCGRHGRIQACAGYAGSALIQIRLAIRPDTRSRRCE